MRYACRLFSKLSWALGHAAVLWVWPVPSGSKVGFNLQPSRSVPGNPSGNSPEKMTAETCQRAPSWIEKEGDGNHMKDTSPKMGFGPLRFPARSGASVGGVHKISLKAQSLVRFPPHAHSAPPSHSMAWPKCA